MKNQFNNKLPSEFLSVMDHEFLHTQKTEKLNIFCKPGFSAATTTLKTKYRYRLNLEKEPKSVNFKYYSVEKFCKTSSRKSRR